MQLILWRHAQAEDGADDLARELTEKGHKQARKMARFLQTKLPKSYQIWVSEAVRSQQTAAYLSPEMQVQAALNPDARWADIVAQINQISATQTVVVVGHQPWLGQLCAALLMQTNAHLQEISVKKGAIWWFDGGVPVGQNPTQLRLMMSPAEIA